MARLPHPVIVVPGITANYLRDEYPIPPDIVWAAITKEYERVALHPDNLRFEATQPARIVPDQLVEVAYRQLVEELRYNLRTREDLPVPVFPFSYDWRQPLDAIELALAAFVEEVIARTKLLRHYDQDGFADDPKVNLVGHSMGGLIIAGYLERAGKNSRAAKVATLASPFQGSFEAVIKVTTGTANLGPSPPSSREREAARLTPSLYHLIPSFANGLAIDPGLPQTTLFDSALWQPSIIETIKSYIQLHGLNKSDRDAQARQLFAGLLKAAQDHRARLDGFKLDKAGLVAADWLCVVGVDSVTRVRLAIKKVRNAAEFNLTSDDRDNRWAKDEPPEQQRLTGDGTVPFEGAVPKFLSAANLVCVKPDDFGYWELRDRALIAAAGFHAILPQMNMLHRMIVAHFTGRADRHGNIWGRPAPGVSPSDWKRERPLPMELKP